MKYYCAHSHILAGLSLEDPGFFVLEYFSQLKFVTTIMRLFVGIKNIILVVSFLWQALFDLVRGEG